MKYRRPFSFVVLLALLVVLSACGTQPTQPAQQEENLWTQAEFQSYVQKASQELNASSHNEALAALGAVPAGAPVNLSALAAPSTLQDAGRASSFLRGVGLSASLAPANNSGGVIELPRGKYVFDGQEWALEEDSEDLYLIFPFSNLDGTTSNVTVQVNWDKYKPTTEVTDGSVTYEMPTGLQIRSFTDGPKSGYIDIYADWYESTCGTTLLEPSNIAIKGEFGYSGTINVDFEINVKKSAGSSNLVAASNTGGDFTVKSDGYVRVNVDKGEDSGKVSWNNVFYGKETRNSNCTLNLAALEITGGEIDFTAKFKIDGKSDTLQLRFTFGSISFSTDGFVSVDLDGKVKINGETVVLFEGTLDATGENLILTFADGQMTLAEFVKGIDVYLPALDPGELPNLPL
jgi:hypothetical protein